MGSTWGRPARARGCGRGCRPAAVRAMIGVGRRQRAQGGDTMRCFRVELRDGSHLRIRASHLFPGDGLIQLCVWHKERGVNHAIAMFPVTEVLRVYAEESLVPDG